MSSPGSTSEKASASPRKMTQQQCQPPLTFLAPDLKSELGKVKFFNLGIFRLDDDASEDATGAVIRRFQAELYCERMEFQFGPVINA